MTIANKTQTTDHLSKNDEKVEVAMRLRNMPRGTPMGISEQIYRDSTPEQTIRNAAYQVPDYMLLYKGAGLDVHLAYVQNAPDYSNVGGVTGLEKPIAQGRNADPSVVDIDLVNKAEVTEMIVEIERFVSPDEHNLKPSTDRDVVVRYLRALFANQIKLIKQGKQMLPRSAATGSVSPIHAKQKVVELDTSKYFSDFVELDNDDPIDLSLIGSNSRRKMIDEIEKFIGKNHNFDGMTKLFELEAIMQAIHNQQRAKVIAAQERMLASASQTAAEVASSALDATSRDDATEIITKAAMMSEEELRENAPPGVDFADMSKAEMFNEIVSYTLAEVS